MGAPLLPLFIVRFSHPSSNSGCFTLFAPRSREKRACPLLLLLQTLAVAPLTAMPASYAIYQMLRGQRKDPWHNALLSLWQPCNCPVIVELMLIDLLYRYESWSIILGNQDAVDRFLGPRPSQTLRLGNSCCCRAEHYCCYCCCCCIDRPTPAQP